MKETIEKILYNQVLLAVKNAKQRDGDIGFTESELRAIDAYLRIRSFQD